MDGQADQAVLAFLRRFGVKEIAKVVRGFQILGNDVEGGGRVKGDTHDGFPAPRINSLPKRGKPSPNSAR